jgi:hypothetical protein
MLAASTGSPASSSAKAVIDVAVMRLVRPDDEDHVAERRRIAEAPVALCDLRRRHVGAPALVDLLEVKRVAQHRLLLEIADDAVRGPGARQIEREESQVEDPLDGEDHEALERGRLRHLDEGHEVHPLILRLVHQGADPALVVAHAAQAFEVRDRGADHSGHRRHRLEHDGAVAVALGEEGVGAEAKRLGEAIGDAIGGAARLVMDAEIDGRYGHGSSPGQAASRPRSMRK